ncbi:hypothetical protein [Rathayibacter sp. VKM Ac-2760]|uniref:hypothetical protein n=1 Tax=Rathayibacter sp. VKM Ac-2760 TaxID=2609253 RepID=UPI0013187F7F|nr:hypothetical protein [Rathayibacter sp. VKM Ac-2760]QHC58333.1 hypothetical protein GSU72_07065 [Rathayibacter sp. VKM Ac-2760]
MKRRRIALLSALSLASMLALSACSAPADDAPEKETSPLSAYLDTLYGGDLSPEEQKQKDAEQDRAREELIATCMREQGFDYTPSVQSGSFAEVDEDDYRPDDREWVVQYGYGIADFPGRDEPVEPGEEYVDANADYVAGLSESEQAAFSEALNGPAVTEDESGSAEYDWTTAGCFGAAQHELEKDEPARSEEHRPVLDAIDEFYSRVQTTPELADLDAAWSSCLADAGHPGFATEYDAQNSINDELTAVYEAAGDTTVEPTDPKLQAVGEKEIELALADLDCREKTDYKAVHKRIQDALEQQFVDDHRAELDALKADAEQGE